MPRLHLLPSQSANPPIRSQVRPLSVSQPNLHTPSPPSFPFFSSPAPLSLSLIGAGKRLKIFDLTPPLPTTLPKFYAKLCQEPRESCKPSTAISTHHALACPQREHDMYTCTYSFVLRVPRQASQPANQPSITRRSARAEYLVPLPPSPRHLGCVPACVTACLCLCLNLQSSCHPIIMSTP